MIDSAAFRHRRARIADSLPLENALLLVAAGDPIPLPETSDQHYPYRAHAAYRYLAGIEAPGAVLAFDPADGPESGWVSFVPRVTADERIWEGRRQPPGRPIDELAAWLETRTGRPICNLGARLPDLPASAELEAACRQALLHARRPKDAEEIALIRRAVEATAAGFAALPAHARAGQTERAIQIELEAAFFRHGADRTGYDTIVAAGPDAAVLHFPPGPRTAAPGDFLLIDAGAEVQRYVADVSRTFVIGSPTPLQRDLHQLVLETELEAIDRCRPGVEWRDIHLGAALRLTAGLVDLGLLRGEPASLVEQRVHLLFFPHGIGHMVGLGVRDASGTAPGRPRSSDPALRALRCDFPLEAGYVMTVEPGLYFIPPLLDDPEHRRRHRDTVNWERVDRCKHLGGIRIEDNILIKPEGPPEILTAAIPRHLIALPA